jgi:TorA maturation chaperone TorD
VTLVKSNKSVYNERFSDEKLPGSDEAALEASALQEQKNIIVAREGIYLFLSRVFMFEVDNEFLTTIVAIQPTINALASSQQGTELQKAGELLQVFSKKAAIAEGEERDRMLTDLAVDYASLFLVPGFSRQVYPWESAYFSQPPRMFGEPYHQMVAAYKKVGYEKPQNFKDAEDHVALELDFMAYLCRLARAGIEAGNVEYAVGYLKLQKEFLQDHLNRWAGKLCTGIIDKSESQFYKAIGMLMRSFLARESQTVDNVALNLKPKGDGEDKDEAGSPA